VILLEVRHYLPIFVDSDAYHRLRPYLLASWTLVGPIPTVLLVLLCVLLKKLAFFNVKLLELRWYRVRVLTLRLIQFGRLIFSLIKNALRLHSLLYQGLAVTA